MVIRHYVAQVTRTQEEAPEALISAADSTSPSIAFVVDMQNRSMMPVARHSG
jgi:hypothetical protein